MSYSPYSYRDRIYIVKDVILKLMEHGELNQTALLSFCGLNFKKHKSILEDMESNMLVDRNQIFFGKRTITVYKSTQKGIEFCRTILEPFETMFPRGGNNGVTSEVKDYHHHILPGKFIDTQYALCS
jgi:predicted transcriptional regulator